LLEAFLFELEWGEDVGVLRYFAEMGSLLGEKNWPVRLGDPEDRRPRNTREDETDPKGPSPA